MQREVEMFLISGTKIPNQKAFEYSPNGEKMLKHSLIIPISFAWRENNKYPLHARAEPKQKFSAREFPSRCERAHI